MDARPKIRAPRFDVGLRVICETPDGVWPGTIVDMSESGVFVTTDQSLPDGAEVTLVPDVEDDSQLPGEMRAVVVRVGELGLDNLLDDDPVQGIAFRLVGLSVAHFAQVRAFLRKHGKRRQTKP